MDPTDPLRSLAVDVVADRADNPDADPRLFRDVFRAHHRLAVDVFERQRQYRVSYSLSDIHRLTFLSEEERTSVKDEWKTWHRSRRLGSTGSVAWLAAAALTWFLWFRGAAAAGVLQSALGVTVPILWLQILGTLIACGLLATMGRFLRTIASPALCDVYLQGYTDGVTRGVNRALRITPEIEKEMWDELRNAERLDATLREPVIQHDIPRFSEAERHQGGSQTASRAPAKEPA